jgi:hypothetical protein
MTGDPDLRRRVHEVSPDVLRRQSEVLDLLRDGLSNADIAAQPFEPDDRERLIRLAKPAREGRRTARLDRQPERR